MKYFSLGRTKSWTIEFKVLISFYNQIFVNCHDFDEFFSTFKLIHSLLHLESKKNIFIILSYALGF